MSTPSTPGVPDGLTAADWADISSQLPPSLAGIGSFAAVTQQAYVKASNAGADDWFGYSVAMSGDTVVVGARSEGSDSTGVNGDQDNESASGSGAAYVFVRSGRTWSQQAYLKASNTRTGDHFG